MKPADPEPGESEWLPEDGHYFYGKVLYDAGTCLGNCLLIAEIQARSNVALPDDTMAWLEQRLPTIKVILEELRTLLHHLHREPPAERLPWTELVDAIAPIIAEAPVLERETAVLSMPSAKVEAGLVRGLNSSMAELTRILQEIEAREYEQLSLRELR